MSAPVLLEVEGIGKLYPLVHRRGQRLRALWDLVRHGRSLTGARVLDGIGFEIRRGESMGLIGENGAGKSTLLKIIAGVLAPTEGSVRLHGRVGALLELGAGFHPERTGRENILTAATLMGMPAAEISERTAEIIAFADIGEYIDEPVKHYSSGMVVRLGFAVIAAVRPELLITDEVLAVGDESFQKKCVRWMESYLSGGGTLLLVSHSMYHVQKLCRRACWLKDGRIERSGDVYEVTQEYLAYHERKSAPSTDSASAPLPTDEYRVTRLLLNGSETQSAAMQQGGELTVEVHLQSPDGRAPVITLGIVRADGTPVYGISSEMAGVSPLRSGDGSYIFAATFSALALLPGGYQLRAHAMDPEGLRLFDTVERDFSVRGESREFGLVRLPMRWHQP